MDFTTIIIVAVVGYVAWKSGVFDKLLGSTKYSTKPNEGFDFSKIAAILAALTAITQSGLLKGKTGISGFISKAMQILTALKTVGMAKASMILSPKKKDDEK